MGTISERTGRGYKDEIDEVLGTRIYAERHYDVGLRDLLLTKHSTDLIPVSRFYPRREPPTIIDFEPAPGAGRWYAQEKRAYFNARGIVYVPIGLAEILTTEQFRERLDAETDTMEETRRVMDVYPGETVDPDILSASRAEAYRQCQILVAAGTLAQPSPAYDHKLTALTRAYIADLTAQEADGRLGSALRTDDASLAAR